MKIIWKRMCHTIKRYPLLFVKSMLMVSVITFFNILIPYGMRSFIDRISLQKDTVFICMGIVGFLAIMLINTIFEIKWYVILDEFGGKCIDDLTVTVEESLFHACQNKIDAVG